MDEFIISKKQCGLCNGNGIVYRDNTWYVCAKCYPSRWYIDINPDYHEYDGYITLIAAEGFRINAPRIDGYF